MNRSSFIIASTLAAIAGACALVACGDDDTVVNDMLVDGGAQDGTTPTDTGVPDTGGQDATPDTGFDAGPPVTASTIVKTNPALGELAEGIAYRGTDTYLSYAPTGKIVKVSSNGTVTPYAQVPISATSASKNFALGLAFDAAGALYVAVSTATPADVLAPAGVYKIPPGGTDGGAITPVPFATSPSMNLPNALLFEGGLLWITDSTGTLFNVNATTGGVATAYLADATLQGDNAACPLPGQPFPIGANGITLDTAKANFYVANTNKGTIIRIPRLTDGGTPTATVVMNDCSKLEGIDGLITDSKTGNLLGVNNGQNLVLRIVPPLGDAGVGTITTIYSGAPLDSPASIVEIPGSVSPQVFHIANAAFVSASLPADAGVTPAPGLMRLTIR